jgi:NB-ARC domain
MVTPARVRPDDFAFAKGNVPLVTAPDLDPLRSVPIRSADRRRWAADLTSPALAGLVLHGAGGIGKSTLASQIVSRITDLEPEWVTAVIRGQVSVDAVLGGVAAALRRHPAVAQGGGQAQSVRAAGRADLPWAHRLALLRELLLGQVPVLLVLDDFDDNVSPVSGGWTVRDPALAELIASWSSKSHRGRLLITCRHPFRPPRTSGPPLTFHHVGPLSRSGAFELAKSLPALGSLGEQELDRAWRLLGGHPQAMEYLDSLLAMGEVRFPEVAGRLAVALEGKSAGSARPADPAAPTELAPTGAESVALTARDLLLRELSGPSSIAVPRWAAGPLRRLGRAGPMWAGLGRAGPMRAGLGRAGWVRAGLIRTGLVLAGLVLAAAAGALVLGRPGSSAAHTGPAAPTPTPTGQQAVLHQASAIRSRAAAWVARQVSQDAIVACDPDMCSALLAQRIAPGNLLELRAGAPDPLGSDVLVATAAVRSQFGARLASVYAPAVLASFGSGHLRIEVRAVAPDGAAAYRAGLAADLTARRDAGRQLLGNPHLRLSPAARSELQAGRVDPRLLTTLAALAAGESVQVAAFGDSGPGAGAGVPLRSAVITVAGRADPAALADMLTFVRAQRPPYLPARSLIEPGAAGASVLSIQFAAPSPMGLLQPGTTP